MTASPPSIYRPGGITYLHIPSTDPGRSARFYAKVFGWKVRDDPGHASFEDATGHVIGAWVSERAGSGDTGVLPYVYVDDADAVLQRVVQAGGEIRKPAYAEGNLRVATFSDPTGTVIGVWQRS